MMRLYRSHPIRSIFAMTCGAVGIMFGTCGIYVNGLESVWLFGVGVVVGLLIVISGFAVVTRRVVIDERGLSKSDMYRTEFRLSWDEIESWWRRPVVFGDPMCDDSFTHEKVEFHLRDGRKRVVYDSDVGRPGFDQFVIDIQQLAKQRGIS